MDQDSLMVAVVLPRAYVRVQGRGSFQLGTALKKFALSAVSRGCRMFVIDMEECIGMDSTFMGVMAGIAMRLRKHAEQGEMVIVNLDAKNAGLLKTLGLANVVHMIMAPLSEEQRRRIGLPRNESEGLERIPTGREDRIITARTMLSAHEHLVEASSENEPRFKEVLKYLEEDIRRNEKAAAGED